MATAITSVTRGGPRKPRRNVSHDRFELSAYVDPPDTEIDISTFERLAIARLNVLRWVEKQRGLGRPLYYRESADTVRDRSVKYLDNVLKDNELTSSQSDRTSHFICRIAFCRTDEHRRWFIEQELALFQARYNIASNDEKSHFLQELIKTRGEDISYDTLGKMDLVREGFNGKTPIPMFSQGHKLPNEDRLLPYHKVPWFEVPTLVLHRRVLLHEGYAFVPNNQFANIITGKFRQALSEALTSASRSMDSIRNDTEAMSSFQRVNPIVRNLAQMSVTKYKAQSVAGRIDAKMIPELAPVHFPLCMQNSFDHLARDHHLKHGARMHFGLFLKGIGLDLRNTHAFFKKMFAPKTTGEKFEKDYAYMWRHQHGVEGNRRNYSPYGCAKIISTQPNRDDHHGCPYKLFDEAHLKRLLRMRKVSDGDAKRIIELKNNHHYQIACRTFFEVTHRQVMSKTGQSINDIESAASWSHPNAYFDLSFSLHNPELARTNREGILEQRRQAMGTDTGSGSQPQATVPTIDAMDIDG